MSTLEQRQLQTKIRELRERDYLPAPLTSLVASVAEIQLAARSEARFDGAAGTGEAPAALPDELVKRFASADARRLGAPLLPRRDFPLDVPLATRLVPGILAAVGEHAPHLRPAREELETMLAEKPDLLATAFHELLRESPSAGEDQGNAPHAPDAPLAQWEAGHPDTAFFFRFVVQSVLTPSLAVAGNLLGKYLDSAVTWPHGHCPVCGSLPLMGRLVRQWQGSEGARLHTCSFCFHEYRAPRLGCPFCLAEPGEESRYFSAPEEPGYLLEVCDSCGQYFKLADFRELDRPWLPALDDLLSLALDAYARNLGYARPTVSAWGF
jgi:FdhE protein